MCTCCAYVGKCEKGFVWSNRREKLTYVNLTQGCMATPTRKRKYEEVRWSLSCSSLAVRCAGVSAFRFPIVGVLSLVAISTTHCTVHMSVAWRLGSVGTCNVSVSREWDGHGRSVGRSGSPQLATWSHLNATWWRNHRAAFVAHSKRRTRFTPRAPPLFGTKLAQWILLGEL